MGRREGGARERIFEAALKCFAESGYFNTSLNRIAEEAGVSKALILWYFPSKDSLIVEVAIKSLPLDIITECLRDESLAGVKALECVVDGYVRKYGDEVMRKLLFHTLALRGLYEPVSRCVNALCRKALRELARRAYGDLSPDSIVRVRALLGGLICYTLNPIDGMGLEEYGRALLKLLAPKPATRNTRTPPNRCGGSGGGRGEGSGARRPPDYGGAVGKQLRSD